MLENFTFFCSSNSVQDPTALYVAMAHSDDAVRLVLKYGADPCIASNKGYPLHMMIEAGKLDLAELMLECKAEVNHKFLGGPLFNGRTALHVAMAHSDDAVRLVLKYGADPNIRSNQDELAIHIAVSSGRMEVAKLLLQSKADVNLKNKSGESPLHVAVNCKSGQDVRWLVDVGADLNDKRDSDEATALHLVIATRQHMLFGVLLDQPKLDLEARLRTTNESVFHLAVKQPADLEMAAALVDRVQCIESVDSSGQTALTMLQAQIEAERNLGRKKALMEFSERLINKLAPCIVQ
jgi:ankyrin repeat protein